MYLFHKSAPRFLLALGLLSLTLSKAFAEETPAVAARVNDKVILRAEVDEQVESMIQRFGGQMPPEQLAMIKEQLQSNVLDQLITQKLLNQQVEEAGIEISDEELEEAVATLSQQLPPGVTLDEQLEMMGMSVEEMRKQLKEGLAIDKLFEAKFPAGNFKPADEEITAFYEENKEAYFTRPESATASHILVDSREKIESIRTAILEGADFAEQAREHSSCPSGQEGGNLGDFSRGMMVPPFEEAAFSQEIGKVGGVVETQFGFHIILVTERTEAGEVELEEVRADISEFLEDQKRRGAEETFLNELREKAEIEILPTP